jgi:hypothetical protein
VEFAVVDEPAGLVDYEDCKHHPASHVRQSGAWSCTGAHCIHGDQLGVNVFRGDVLKSPAFVRWVQMEDEVNYSLCITLKVDWLRYARVPRLAQDDVYDRWCLDPGMQQPHLQPGRRAPVVKLVELLYTYEGTFTSLDQQRGRLPLQPPSFACDTFGAGLTLANTLPHLSPPLLFPPPQHPPTTAFTA